MSDGTQAAPDGVGTEAKSMAEAGAQPSAVPESGVQQILEKVREVAHRDPATDRLRGNEDGKFKPEPRLDQFEEPAPAEEDEEYVTVGDLLADEEEVAPVDPPVEEEAAEDLPVELTEGEPAAETEQKEAQRLKVALPPRHDRDDELEVEIAVPEGVDPQVAQDRFNQMRNEGMRRQEFVRAMEAVEAEKQELEGLKEVLREPGTAAEFVLQQVAPEVQMELARQMLAGMDTQTFTDVVQDVAKWSRDPDERERAALAAENARLKRQQAKIQQTNEDPGLAEVRNAVLAIIPESVPDRTAERIWHLAMQEVAQYVQKNQLTSLSGPQAAEIVRRSGLMDDFKLGSTSAGPTTPAAATGAAPESKGQTGRDLASRAEKRKAATAVAPAGAGASSAATLQFKRNQTITERLKAVNEARRKGILRFGRS